MLQIAICDDIKTDLQFIKDSIEGFFSRQSIKTTISTYLSSTELLADKNFITTADIIFLDINMPQINGIDAGREIRKHNYKAKIVYITGYSEYIQTAIDTAHCFFYLLKPISAELISQKLSVILAYLKKETIKFEFINAKTKYYYAAEEIYCFEHSDRKTTLFTKDGSINISTSLTDLAADLKPYGFAMPHRSTLVNLRYIRSISADYIQLTNNRQIQLSQRKRKEFKETYNTYLQSCLIN